MLESHKSTLLKKLEETKSFETIKEAHEQVFNLDVFFQTDNNAFLTYYSKITRYDQQNNGVDLPPSLELFRLLVLHILVGR